MVKKIAIGIASLGLLLGTACSGDEQARPAEPTVTVTAEPEPTPEPEASTPELTEDETKAVFLSVVRENEPVLSSVSDADLIALAMNACTLFENGGSAEDMADIIMENTADPQLQEAAGFTVGAGVSAFCPEHTEKITGGTGA